MTFIKILFFTVILSLGTQGCGKEESRDTGEFESYVTRFEAEARVYGQPLSVENVHIQFASVGAQELGVCLPLGSESYIKVDPQRWQGLDDMGRETLVFHELGHCVLRRDHLNQRLPLPDDRPVSLMHAELVSTSTYAAHRTEYLRELFQPSHLSP